jgi:hypothetical protein
MKRTSIACAAALILAAAMQPAQARNRGGAVAAGIIGGIAAGAIIAGAANARGPYDGPVYAPAYEVAPPPAGCYARQEVWSNRHQAYVVRNVRVPCY